MFILGANAQIQAPQPSPFSKVEQKVGLTDVTIEYSRPGMRDREIFGNLVPFGEVWRTGANENTKITFSDDVEIGGKTLKKGTYAIFTKPGKESWEVMFYSDATNWGIPAKWDESKVALTATAEVSEFPLAMETFTILLNDLKNDSAVLSIVWENTMASLPIKFPTDAKTLASIGCKAALPETINSIFPPKPSFHLEKMSFLAMFNLVSYHHPFAPYGSNSKPSSTAQ